MIDICLIFFFPFLLDTYDFMWAEEFLYKLEPFTHPSMDADIYIDAAIVTHKLFSIYADILFN
jgi:hypothetical protein